MPDWRRFYGFVECDIDRNLFDLSYRLLSKLVNERDKKYWS